MPSLLLHGEWNSQECADVRNRAIQLLKVYVQGLALRTSRLFVQAHSLHVKPLENSIVENVPGVLDILSLHGQLDSTDEIRNEPVQPHHVLVGQETLDTGRLQTPLRQ